MANPEHVELIRKGAEAIREWRVENPKLVLDLSVADLSDADLSRANLVGANLSSANLSGAYLSGADLSGADLRGTNLDHVLFNFPDFNLHSNHVFRANLSRTNLSGVDLSRADLSGVNLSDADLSRANLSDADLSNANLSRANLRGGDLIRANLSGANLRDANLSGANLSGANLSDAKLSGADLIDADLSRANLSGAGLRRAKLCDAKLSGAKLSGAKLSGAELSGADLTNADLTNADLSNANLRDANLRNAKLIHAKLIHANLRNAKLIHANLNNAHLNDANLIGADLSDSNLIDVDAVDAKLGSTVIANIDLRAVKSLKVTHYGPSHISNNTLVRSHGAIPDEFLQGCGFQLWEILQAKMYDPTLTPPEISELQYKIFDKRTHGPLFIGGVFISYSLADAQFVDRIYERLKKEGAPVWLDRHDVIAGPLQKQIANAIRLHDVVLLVLSKASTESDWVENELDMARKKEKSENRDVLCPVKLDESWQAKLEDSASDRVLWRTLTKQAIIDFSPGTDFEEQFGKLLRGLKIYYKSKLPAIESPGP